MREQQTAMQPHVPQGGTKVIIIIITIIIILTIIITIIIIIYKGEISVEWFVKKGGRLK